MTLWVILTIMTSAAAVFVAVPLLRRFEQRQAAFTGSLEVYRDQLKEVEKEAAGGSIDADQADTARIEINRRILAADRTRDVEPARPRVDRNLVAIAITAIVVLGSVMLYALNGRPELPSSPTVGKAAGMSGSNAVEQLAALTRSQSAGEGQQSPALASVDEMIERLVERLKRNPGDAEGWRMLGWSYFNVDRYAESAAAYGKAIALNPNVAEFRSARGEALVRASNDLVTAEAKGEFEAALKLAPKDPRARFFMGLAKEQTGEKVAALDDWIAILNEADPNEPWVADLLQRTTDLGREVGVDVSRRLHIPQGAAAGGVLNLLKERETGEAPKAQAKGPSAEQVAAAEAMAPAERIAMIRGMVANLERRLEQSPRDVDGWIRLIRSRTVLGEMAAAKQALNDALKVFSDAPQEQSRISASAQELGVTQ